MKPKLPREEQKFVVTVRRTVVQEVDVIVLAKNDLEAMDKAEDETIDFNGGRTHTTIESINVV